VVASSKGPLLVFWTSWHPCELSTLPPTHLPFLVANSKWDWVILSAFACEFASSGTWGSLWLRICCYSWWLPPPRRLGATEELWQEWCLFFATSRWFVRGVAPSSAKRRKVALVNCSCHWVNSLVVGSCGTLGELRFGLPISHRTTKWWSTQWGCSVPASTWTSGKKIIVFILCWLTSPGDWSSYSLIGLSPMRRYKDHIPSIYIPQTSYNKLFSVISF
jgi:hypothetical protein